MPEDQKGLSEERLTLVHRYMTETEASDAAVNDVNPVAGEPAPAPSKRPTPPQPAARPAAPRAASETPESQRAPARASSSKDVRIRPEKVHALVEEAQALAEEARARAEEAHALPEKGSPILEGELPILEWIHAVVKTETSPPDPSWPQELVELRRERWKRYHAEQPE